VIAVNPLVELLGIHRDGTTEIALVLLRSHWAWHLRRRQLIHLGAGGGHRRGVCGLFHAGKVQVSARGTSRSPGDPLSFTCLTHRGGARFAPDLGAARVGSKALSRCWEGRLVLPSAFCPPRRFDCLHLLAVRARRRPGQSVWSRPKRTLGGYKACLTFVRVVPR
jgi:hypothetical protein